MNTITVDYKVVENRHMQKTVTRLLSLAALSFLPNLTALGCHFLSRDVRCVCMCACVRVCVRVHVCVVPFERRVSCMLGRYYLEQRLHPCLFHAIPDKGPKPPLPSSKETICAYVIALSLPAQPPHLSLFPHRCHGPHTHKPGWNVSELWNSLKIHTRP